MQENKKEEEKLEIDAENIANSIQELRDIASQIEKNGDNILEAGTYCSLEDLAIQGMGMNKSIEDCGNNHKNMAEQLRAYADSLEEGLMNSLK